MISQQDKCLFVHIPKTAGQSIESVFVKRAGLTWEQREHLLLRPNREKHLGPPRLAHLLAKEYVQLGYIDQATFEQYFKFTFVRNPWARLLSEFNYRKSHGDVDYQCSFKKFVIERLPTAEKDCHNSGKDYYRHILPQYYFIYDDNDKCLVDFVGKFEHLQTDFNKVCKIAGLDTQLLPFKNRTIPTSFAAKIQSKFNAVFGKNVTQRHYQNFYDDETQEFVRQFYQKDIELFDYEF